MASPNFSPSNCNSYGSFSVLIEIGYASHKDEGKLIAKKDYQKLIAKGIADGIDGYFLRNY